MDVVYPPACICCGELLNKDRLHICALCETKISYLQEPCCLKCGKEIEEDDREFCSDCSTLSRTFEKGFPVMCYEEPISDSLAKFKYAGKRQYATYYAKEIVKKHGRNFFDLGIEALIPVPIHKEKLKKRGYNQAKILATELGRLLDIPVDDGIIKRIVNTLPQKELDNKKREENLRNAFIYTGKIVEYKCVLLVDDIYTTGATIEACTRVLKEQNIRNIYYTSLCIGKEN